LTWVGAPWLPSVAPAGGYNHVTGRMKPAPARKARAEAAVKKGRAAEF
jgi:hypothetical protein